MSLQHTCPPPNPPATILHLAQLTHSGDSPGGCFILQPLWIVFIEEEVDFVIQRLFLLYNSSLNKLWVCKWKEKTEET